MEKAWKIGISTIAGIVGACVDSYSQCRGSQSILRTLWKRI